MVVAALYDWLLLAHIVAAMVWVGGVVALLACSTAVLLTRDVALISRFVGILRRVGPVVLAPAPALVLAFGVWMVAGSEAWGFDQLWVSLAFGLLLAAFLYGAAFQSRAALAAERASVRGD